MTRIIENGVHVGPVPLHRAARAGEKADPPVAPEVTVNGRVIPRFEIEAEAQNHPAASPGLALRAAARALAVRDLLLQEADRLGIEPRPALVDPGRREMPEDAAIRQLLEQEVRVPEADEAACRRYFDNNRRRFTSPTLYEARHILLAAAPDDTEACKAAQDLAERLLAILADRPDRFGDLAAEWSACPSKDQGGNLGQVSNGQTVPEFEAALAGMAAGEIGARPISSRFGLHIIGLERRIDGAELPFETVRDRIAAYLEAASWSRAVSQYLSLLAGAATIEGVDLGAADSPLVQ
ncbi:MAG: peptidylprolyl isomerase [Alphaproteobacteria bacterium]